MGLRGGRLERGLAVVGAATILVVGFDAVTFAATGSSLLLGRVNQANAVTTVQNTGAGAALNLVTKSTASPPLTTNAKGLVPNLFAGRAANADRVGGLTVAQVRAGSIPPAGRTHLVGQSGEPAFGAFTNGFSPLGLDNYGAGFPPVSFRKDQLGVVHIGGLMCITDGGSCFSKVVASAAFETLFTLPPGFRPASRQSSWWPTLTALGGLMCSQTVKLYSRPVQACSIASSRWMALVSSQLIDLR